MRITIQTQNKIYIDLYNGNSNFNNSTELLIMLTLTIAQETHTLDPAPAYDCSLISSQRFGSCFDSLLVAFYLNIPYFVGVFCFD